LKENDINDSNIVRKQDPDFWASFVLENYDKPESGVLDGQSRNLQQIQL